MSDLIHLDPTGIGGAGSANPTIASAAARQDAHNLQHITRCGLKLSEVEHVGVARLADVTCQECLGQEGPPQPASW